ncbi:hypothetical protein VDGL01_11285 [Verticillium dahliae]
MYSRSPDYARDDLLGTVYTVENWANRAAITKYPAPNIPHAFQEVSDPAAAGSQLDSSQHQASPTPSPVDAVEYILHNCSLAQPELQYALESIANSIERKEVDEAISGRPGDQIEMRNLRPL